MPAFASHRLHINRVRVTLAIPICFIILLRDRQASDSSWYTRRTFPVPIIANLLLLALCLKPYLPRSCWNRHSIELHICELVQLKRIE
ncbi:hypothetical protein BDV95DRAFT_576989 [Massariosphaeria phaeospora]|uniref:Uncharacterized protein n=1 Tax=Massariosphaeria phaeospora TaxID=100035 RepID=A0A7C8MH23_9PLEO|nr:hypothetical protein BDV95DRAFT_576989 [Massariosphaeria phaeospora]